jgi:phosphotransferase system HPr-like phosphotransfer protein
MSKGKAGAPLGNKNGVRGTQAKQALQIALRHNGQKKRVVKDMACLVEIWSKTIEQAKEGDNQSINMIMERLDGKPGQSIDVTAEGTIEVRALTVREASAINKALDDDF